MTKLATMGCSSCATIALQGFKDDNIQANEIFIKTGEDIFAREKGLSVSNFYDGVLYPTEQELGRTRNYPFDLLMQEIDTYEMGDKFVIAVINSYQYHCKNKYWPNIFEKHGFSLLEKTKNSIGEVNYIYTRNKAKVK